MNLDRKTEQNLDKQAKSGNQEKDFYEKVLEERRRSEMREEQVDLNVATESEEQQTGADINVKLGDSRSNHERLTL